tara:strand:- start:502 stop:954 length:453 start_codon:yes stop_codon:yes gene_type:complete
MVKKSNKNKFLIIFFIFICLLIFPDYNYFTSEKVTIKDAHLYLPMKGKDMSAGYLRITNNHSKNIVIKSIECQKVNASLHETVIDSEGVIKMKKLKLFSIDPESHVDFMPGGKHIMFSGFSQFEERYLQCNFVSDIGLTIPFTLEVLNNE